MSEHHHHHGRSFRVPVEPGPFNGHATLRNSLAAYWKLEEATRQNRLSEVGDYPLVPYTLPFQFDDIAQTSENVVDGFGVSIQNSAYLQADYASGIGIGEAGNGATWNFWIYNNGGGDPGGWISWSNGSGNNAMSLYIQGGGATWKCYTSENESVNGGGIPPSFMTLVMYTMVWNDNGDKKVRAYMNGLPIGSPSAAANVATLKSMAGEFLQVGRFAWGARTFTIDEFGAWDRALTQAEITALATGLYY